MSGAGDRHTGVEGTKPLRGHRNLFQVVPGQGDDKSQEQSPMRGHRNSWATRRSGTSASRRNQAPSPALRLETFRDEIKKHIGRRKDASSLAL